MMRTAEANRILAPTRRFSPTPGLRSALENAVTLATPAILSAAGLDPERTPGRDREARRLVYQALYSRACRSGLYSMGYGYAAFASSSGMRPDFDSSDSFTVKDSSERLTARDLLERELARYQTEPHPEADAAAEVTRAQVALRQARDRRDGFESRRTLVAQDVSLIRAQLATLEARHDDLAAAVAKTTQEIAAAETALSQAQASRIEVDAGARVLEASLDAEEAADDTRLAEERAQREEEAAAHQREEQLAQAAEAMRKAEEHQGVVDQLRELGRRVLSGEVVVPPLPPPSAKSVMPMQPDDGLTPAERADDERNARRRAGRSRRELP